MIESMKNFIQSPEFNQIAPIVTGVGGLGLLGYGLYRSYSSGKKTAKELNDLIKQLPSRMAKSTATDMDSISSKLGLQIPIAVIQNNDKLAKQYGVLDNAFFMQPGAQATIMAKSLKPYIRKHYDKAKDSGLVVMSDKFSPVPILAHELGHARDHKDGNLSTTPNILAAALGFLTPFAMLKSGLSYDIAKEVADSTKSKFLGGLSSAAATLAVPALSSLFINYRTRAAERRATEHAKRILDTYRYCR